MDNQTQDPGNPQSQPQSPSSSPTPDNQQPQQPVVVQSTPVSRPEVQPLTDTATPTSPTAQSVVSQVFPEPQNGFASSAPMSKASLKAEDSEKKKHKRLVISLACITVVVIAGLSGFLSWYLPQDHSIYSKLTSVSYSGNGQNYTFLRPKIFNADPQAENKSILLTFGYNNVDDPTSANFTAAVTLVYIGFGGPLLSDYLQITPSQAEAQVISGSGSFVSFFKNPGFKTNAYNQIFGGCSSYITTNSGQKDLFCDRTLEGNRDIRVTAISATSISILSLQMKPVVYMAHEKVWEKIEKSFNFNNS